MLILGSMRIVPFSTCLDIRLDPRSPGRFSVFYCVVPENPSADVTLKCAEFNSLVGAEEAESWVDLLRQKVFAIKPAEEVRRRSITVLINPFGGVGAGRSVWQSVLPILRAAPVNLNVVETTSAGFGESYASTLDIAKMRDGIVTVSGDGLLHEVVNGLLRRPDWEQARLVPIGVIVRSRTFVHGFLLAQTYHSPQVVEMASPPLSGPLPLAAQHFT